MQLKNTESETMDPNTGHDEAQPDGSLAEAFDMSEPSAEFLRRARGDKSYAAYLQRMATIRAAAARD
jgi:hypothetical protein